MANPTVQTRTLPSGFKLPDGFRTTIALESNVGVQFWEKTVQPMGIDGGEPIDTSTMFNTRWHTMYPKTLIKATECKGTAAYDPNVYPELVAIINVACSVTITFPDNATLTFFGALQKVEFKELKEGEMPELDYTITPINYDPLNGIEVGPLYTPAPGTD